MASTKQRADKQKEKEKKEKIVLAALVLILIVVGAVMVPGMFKKKATVGVVAPTAAQSTSTSSSTPSSGTPSASGVSASGSLGAATFPNVFTTYQPADGQLSGFGRFAGNDPFGKLPAVIVSSGASTSTSPTSTTPASAFTAAMISVNGTLSSVALRGGFPSPSNLFSLDSIKAGSIVVSVNNGSLSGGHSSITIKKGHTVVLENTVDGTRYAIKMISPMTSASSGGPTSGFSVSIDTTTTSGTTGAIDTTTTSGTTGATDTGP